jgi:hypothetical protein
MDLPFSLRARFGGKIDASIMTDVFISCDCDVASATVMLTAMVEDENTDEPSGAWSWQSWTAFVRGLEGVLRRLNLGGNVAQWAQSPRVWPGGEFSVARNLKPTTHTFDWTTFHRFAHVVSPTRRRFHVSNV